MGNVAKEAGALRPVVSAAHTWEADAAKKNHLKMALNHHSARVINAKCKAVILLLQEMVFTLEQLIYAIMHLRNLATKQQASGETRV